MKMPIYKKGHSHYTGKYQDFVDCLRFTLNYMAFFPLPDRILKRIKEIEMDELKLENFFEKDKSGHVVRKGDLDLLLLYIATKVDEIVRWTKKT